MLRLILILYFHHIVIKNDKHRVKSDQKGNIESFKGQIAKDKQVLDLLTNEEPKYNQPSDNRSNDN